ncbi:phosphonate metabolism protein/1,5-bisphosphokinase (PRPP-forming) PhnN [Curtobacterium herbarum]|uniref:Ribose 1,5-bisphosphate phosphokinase PhnN n=1 Tax=Curtobacterium herbarum TaxID=150122 RepID=A0ABN1ZBW0_9MICO|nr:phosphonate metabolism protein/1,5-bisphosphokinase (PRPP-forming) PhnN [Curtobacterium herbarum]MBM7473816.1 ribose 1,5-bisphosphokinase [Curtobacterium herbarum]MCS6544854.1 phosphonate metabolism protein/1,5-bisphosphokinase (PRPP-forming) PhnN [Curtobacterium herbarum]
MSPIGPAPAGPTPIGPGTFVAVVGASGVGKDALIDHARARTSDTVRFPRRTITRPSGAGEDHDPLDAAAFAAAARAGAFAVHWHAHGLDYGIPAQTDEDLRAGRTVVANVSRGVLAELSRRCEHLVVVRVSVPDAVRAERLRARSRESAEAVAARLHRPDPAPDQHVDLEICNDGSLEAGGEALLRAILRADAAGRVADAGGPR